MTASLWSKLKLNCSTGASGFGEEAELRETMPSSSDESFGFTIIEGIRDTATSVDCANVSSRAGKFPDGRSGQMSEAVGTDELASPLSAAEDGKLRDTCVFRDRESVSLWGHLDQVTTNAPTYITPVPVVGPIRMRHCHTVTASSGFHWSVIYDTPYERSTRVMSTRCEAHCTFHWSSD